MNSMIVTNSADIIAPGQKHLIGKTAVLNTESFEFSINAASKRKFTEEGYLETEAVIYRAGIFEFNIGEYPLSFWPEYLKGLPLDATVRCLVPREAVANASFLNSAKLKPCTNDHPDEFVDARNLRYVQRGILKDSAKLRGNEVVCPVMFTDSEVIDLIINKGKKQGSIGNYSTFIWERGTDPEFGNYDFIQTDIFINHFAVVWAGRGGEATVINKAVAPADKAASKVAVENEREITMDKSVTIVRVVNGVSIPFSEQGAQAFDQAMIQIEALRTEVENGKKKLVEVENSLSTITAERDKLKADTTDVKAINERAKKRAKLVNAAREIFPEVDEDLSDEEIIRASVTNARPDIDMEGKPAAYFESMFDLVHAEVKNKKNSGLDAATEILNSSPVPVQASEDARQKVANERAEKQRKFARGEIGI